MKKRGTREERNTFRIKELSAKIVSLRSERKQSIDKKTEVVSVVALRGVKPALIVLGKERSSESVIETI